MPKAVRLTAIQYFEVAPLQPCIVHAVLHAGRAAARSQPQTMSQISDGSVRCTASTRAQGHSARRVSITMLARHCARASRYSADRVQGEPCARLISCQRRRLPWTRWCEHRPSCPAPSVHCVDEQRPRSTRRAVRVAPPSALLPLLLSPWKRRRLLLPELFGRA
jgi:hypothetical protein